MRRQLFLLFFVASALFSQTELTGKIITIDPGHGGNNPSNDRRIEPDPGNVFWESEGNFRKALHLRPMLQRRGATVYLTRETNDYPNDADEPSLTARWTFANSKNSTWFHSIHSNAGGGKYTMVLLKEIIATRAVAFPEAVTMSSNIYTAIRAKMRTTASGGNISGYAGVYKDYTFYGGTSGGYNLGVLSGLTMPGELSEGEFHDDFPETRRLLNNDYRKMEALGIYSAMLQYWSAPQEGVGVIAGIVTNSDLGIPQNLLRVRLMPENRIYNGDNFNNGFYMFDSVAPGAHTVYFETPGNLKDSSFVTVTAAGTHFVDKSVKENSTPYVFATDPVKGDTTVKYNASVRITFSKPMDTVKTRLATSITPSIPLTITWENFNRTMVVTANPYFSYTTQYTITVDTSARSDAGFGIDGNQDGIAGDPYSITFRTQRPVAPVVSATSPVNGDTTVTAVSPIRITFSLNMDTSSARTAFSITPSAAGSFSWDGRKDLIFTPASFLSFSTVYTVKVKGSALSETSLPLDGNKDGIGGDDYQFSFKIVKQVPPVVTLTSPKNGDTTVTNVNPLIGIKFSKAMDTTSLKAAFSIVPAVGGTFTFSGDFLVIYFKPSAPLPYKTQFTVSIAGTALSYDKVAIDGNNDGTNGDGYTYQFRTKADPTYVRDESLIPLTTSLEQNYPNPFNPSTTVRFSLRSAATVAVKVYDAMGREVSTLVNDHLPAGVFSVAWNAAMFPSGMYFCTMRTGDVTAVRRMLLVK